MRLRRLLCTGLVAGGAATALIGFTAGPALADSCNTVWNNYYTASSAAQYWDTQSFIEYNANGYSSTYYYDRTMFATFDGQAQGYLDILQSGRCSDNPIEDP